MSDSSSQYSVGSGGEASTQHSGQLEWMKVEAVPDIHVISPGSQLDVDLHFVAETGVARPRGSFRDLIRSQARRKLRHRAGPSQRARLKPLDGNDAKEQQHSEFPEAAFPRLRCPEGNASDPFDALVVGKRGRSQFYIKHYYITFKHTYPSDIMANKAKKDTAMRHAMTDPSFLHATLFHSALSLCKLRGTSFSRDVFYHHGESIRLINERLRDPNLRKVSDVTILTVGCLAHFEILSDYGFNGAKTGMDRQEAKVHFDGLEAMINGRGGLEKVSKEFISGKSTSTFVAWTDTCVAIALNIKPRFPVIQNEKERGDDIWTPYRPLALRYKSKLFNLTGQQELSAETIDVYSMLWNVPPLPQDEAFALIKDGEPLKVYKYKGQLERLERRILAIIQSVPKPPIQSLLIYELFGNASLIHALLFMRDSPASIPLSRLLSNRLRVTIESLDLQNLLLQYPEMILWILILGGLGGIGMSNQQWFAATLAESCVALGLLGGSEIEFTVAEFLWYDVYCGPLTMAFWNDIAIAQGVGGRNTVIDRPRL